MHIVILQKKMQTLVFWEVYNDTWYETTSLKFERGGADEL